MLSFCYQIELYLLRNALFIRDFRKFLLLKLNRSRWLTRQIIEYSVYSTHFIDNSAHHLIQNFIRDLCRLCSHEINCIHCSQCNGIIISSLITHNTNTSHVRQCCEVLTDRAVKSCIGNLLTVDSICILNDTNLIGCYFTNDADSKSRSGNG